MTTDAPSDGPTPLRQSGLDAARLAHSMTSATDSTAPDPLYGKYARGLAAVAAAMLAICGAAILLVAPHVLPTPITPVSVGALLVALASSWAYLASPARMRRSLRGDSTMTRDALLAVSWVVLGAVLWRPIVGAVAADPALGTLAVLGHIAGGAVGAVIGIGADLARVREPGFEPPEFGN
jgi:hypothetical protein